MTPFPDPLHLRALAPLELRTKGLRAQNYELLQPFRYRSATLGEILVPAGFLTDFASIPGCVKCYVDDDSPVILFPSVIHDYLYSCSGRLGALTLTRAQADGIFREAMAASGARADELAIVHTAVRLGGGSHWGK